MILQHGMLRIQGVYVSFKNLDFLQSAMDFKLFVVKLLLKHLIQAIVFLFLLFLINFQLKQVFFD